MEPELKSHNMQLAKNLILQVFFFLEEQYFYNTVLEAIDDRTFIECLDVEYINEIKRRKIRVSYIKSKVYNEVKYTFNGSITRIPYIGNEDFFSLSNYLKSKNKDFSTSLTRDFNEPEAKNILTQIAVAFKKYASNIIDGKEWLETYYPRKD